MYVVLKQIQYLRMHAVIIIAYFWLKLECIYSCDYIIMYRLVL